MLNYYILSDFKLHTYQEIFASYTYNIKYLKIMYYLCKINNYIYIYYVYFFNNFSVWL